MSGTSQRYRALLVPSPQPLSRKERGSCARDGGGLFKRNRLVQARWNDAFITNIAHPCTRHAHPLRKPFT
jgi:hypothetical protein